MFGAVTAEQRLEKNVVKIFSNPKYAALSGVLLIGERSVDDTIPTACTNGRDERYGREMIDALSDAELRYVILHEVRHKLYRHLKTWKNLHDINHSLANAACDYVINLELNDENDDGFAVMPSGDYQGLVDERFRGMDSAQVFNILLNEQPEQPELPAVPRGGGQGPSGVGTQAGTPQQGCSNTTGDNNTPVGFDDHDWEGAQQLTDEEKKELDRQIDQGIRQGVLAANKMRGSGKGGQGINLDALLKPQVDWRDVLREFVTETCSGSDYSTYNRPNRRYMHAGMYLPSGISETVEELVFAVDTSGSCFNDRELRGFMSEVVSVVETVSPERVRILYWDSYIAEPEEVYEQGDYDKLVNATKPKGGGGTDINCVVEHIKENKIDAQAVIVLTDGFLGGDWGEWDCPVLWCIQDNPRAVPDCGKMVHIKTSDLV